MAKYTEKEVLEKILSDERVPSWVRTEHRNLLDTDKPEKKTEPAKVDK